MSDVGTNGDSLHCHVRLCFRFSAEGQAYEHKEVPVGFDHVRTLTVCSACGMDNDSPSFYQYHRKTNASLTLSGKEKSNHE
jgi:hypothetical protein